MASELVESDFLLIDGTLIDDDNKYFERLENATELIIFTEEQAQKLSFYFEIKRSWSVQHLFSFLP